MGQQRKKNRNKHVLFSNHVIHRLFENIDIYIAETVFPYYTYNIFV